MLEDDQHVACYISHLIFAKDLTKKVEKEMDAIVKVPTIESFKNTQQYSLQKKINVLLDSIMSFDRSKSIGYASVQGLEREEKENSVSLELIIEKNTQRTMRKVRSKGFINLSKLAKKRLTTRKMMEI